MRPSGDKRLYERLPAQIRTRDEEHGRPLEALLRIVQEEFELLEGDIQQLYENWFIETCQEWVVPYIADLLAVRNLRPIASADFSMRAYVANTLRYRQGKGTPGVLEDVGSTVSGWNARVAEFFKSLVWSQHVNHIRLQGHLQPNNCGTAEIHSASSMQLNDTAFDTCAHTVEVRRIATQLGRHSIPNVGLFLWRLEPYFMFRSTPRLLAADDPVFTIVGRAALDGLLFHVGQLNMDFPLFNRPKGEIALKHLATEINVPTKIRRLAMSGNKKAYLDAREPSFACYFNGSPVASDGIMVCRLDWEDPKWNEPKATEHPGVQVVVDPERARMMLMEHPDDEDDLEVGYTYGFSGDIGGGPYDRNDGVVNDIKDRTWRRKVNFLATGGASTLANAIADWNALAPTATRGVIAITDNATYTGDLSITIPAESDLLFVSCQDFDPAMDNVINASERRPHLLGDLSVTGEGKNSVFTVNGLLLEGRLQVMEGDLNALGLGHCTIIPPTDAPDDGTGAMLQAGAENRELEVTIADSIVAGIVLHAHVNTLCVRDSIIDRPAIVAINAPGSECTIERCTVFSVEQLEVDAVTNAATPSLLILWASESIFTGPVVVERNQEGCSRFCYFPEGSIVPKRYRCQPDLALDELPDSATATVKAAVITRLRPQFNSRTYGEPDYAQLRLSTDLGIRTGAEDGSEMGAFKFLQQPHREENLRAAVKEYLPFGLQAGLLFIDEADAFRPTGTVIP